MDRWQSLSYWVSERVVNSLTRKNPKKLESRLPMLKCCCSSEVVVIVVYRCFAIVAV